MPGLTGLMTWPDFFRGRLSTDDPPDCGENMLSLDLEPDWRWLISYVIIRISSHVLRSVEIYQVAPKGGKLCGNTQNLTIPLTWTDSRKDLKIRHESGRTLTTKTKRWESSWFKPHPSDVDIGKLLTRSKHNFLQDNYISVVSDITMLLFDVYVFDYYLLITYSIGATRPIYTCIRSPWDPPCTAGTQTAAPAGPFANNPELHRIALIEDPDWITAKMSRWIGIYPVPGPALMEMKSTELLESQLLFLNRLYQLYLY
jgi:hypothetical protein